MSPFAWLQDQEPQLPASRGNVAPPLAIRGLEVRPSAPLEFSRAWLSKVSNVRQRRAQLRSAGKLAGMPLPELVETGAALSGTLRVPVIPVLYANVNKPFSQQALAQRLFGPGRADTVSYASYWREVSSGLLTVEGVVAPWVRLSEPAAYYLPSEDYGWSSFGRVPELRRRALRASDPAVDFGRFDNDGPDGNPNSGDDDGFVDFAIFLYAVNCHADSRAGAIWPHRGAMEPYVTEDAAAGGGRIRVADYIVHPALRPGTCEPLQAGVLAHETGHAFGLPDLYDYDGSSRGIGAWGLMGTGSHSAIHSPAHPSAWTKVTLGWVRVERLDASTNATPSAAPNAAANRTLDSLRIPPVEREPVVFRYDIPGGHGRYLLLENRQRLDSDSELPGGGLLIWRIDPERGELRAWNHNERRSAVRLVQADGRRDLAHGSRADGGDPFPGTSARQYFSLEPAGTFRLGSIHKEGDVIAATLRVGYGLPALVPMPRRVDVAGVPGGPPDRASIRVRKAGGAEGGWSARAVDAPWLTLKTSGDSLIVVADPAGLEPGTYSARVDLVLTGAPGSRSTAPGSESAAPGSKPAAPGSGSGVPEPDSASASPRPEAASPPQPTLLGRERAAGQVAVTFSVVEPGEPTVVARNLPWGWGLAISQGRAIQASYGWDATTRSRSSGLFTVTDSRPFPTRLARLPADALYSPTTTEDGTIFVLARAGDNNYLYRVAPDGRRAEALASIAGGPAYGLAVRPDGGVLVALWDGRIIKVAPGGETTLTMRLHPGIYQIAIGTEGALYAAMYTGKVVRVAADGTRTVIPTTFGSGGLTTVTAASAGGVYVAERGGAGRIIHIASDGARRTIAELPGAAFYGLVADGGFLYALDLEERRLLRVGLPSRTTVVATDEEE